MPVELLPIDAIESYFPMFSLMEPAPFYSVEALELSGLGRSCDGKILIGLTTPPVSYDAVAVPRPDAGASLIGVFIPTKPIGAGLNLPPWSIELASVPVASPIFFKGGFFEDDVSGPGNDWILIAWSLLSKPS